MRTAGFAALAVAAVALLAACGNRPGPGSYDARALTGGVNPRSPLGLFLLSRTHGEMLERAGRRQDAAVGRRCAERNVEAQVMNTRILEDIALDRNGKPRAGVWQTRYSFARCGEVSVYNAGFMVDPETRALVTCVLPPGEIAVPGAALSMALSGMPTRGCD